MMPRPRRLSRRRARARSSDLCEDVLPALAFLMREHQRWERHPVLFLEGSAELFRRQPLTHCAKTLHRGRDGTARYCNSFLEIENYH